MAVGPQHRPDLRRPTDLVEFYKIEGFCPFAEISFALQVFLGCGKEDLPFFFPDNPLPRLLHDLKRRIAEVHQLQILNIKEKAFVGSPVQLVEEDTGVFGHPFLMGNGETYPGFSAVLFRENRVIAQEIPLRP